MTETKTEIDIQKLAQCIAPLLGDGWTYQEPSPDGFPSDRKTFAHIAGPTEARLTLTIRDHPDHINIHGVLSWKYNAFIPYRHGLKSINVAHTKPADTIAKDIVRRLLPNYMRVLAETLKNAQDAEAAATNASNHARELAATLGVLQAPVRPASSASSNGDRDAHFNYRVYTHARTVLCCIDGTASNYENRDTLKIEARHDVALKICEFIASLNLQPEESEAQ
jgi:hypothetical protein